MHNCYNAEKEAHDTARDLMYVTNIVIRGDTEWYEVRWMMTTTMSLKRQ